MTDDLFTHAVIQAGLNAAADEMFEVLRKTAMSPIIYEVLDVGTGVTDDKGNLISSGAGIPTFIGVLDKAVKAIIADTGAPIRDGDVFITNDPNFGGVTHLNDIVIAKPVFFADQCVAWTASIAHWGDVGGKVAGSMAADAQDIFAEGIRLPAVKLYDGGRHLESVFDIIMANSRQPDFVRGDLWAQLAASRRAEKSILNILSTYGTTCFSAAVSGAFKAGKARARKGLSLLPKGKFHIEEEQDNGDIWRASIEISDSSFVVDLSDNPVCAPGPHNTSKDGATIAAQMIFKALCDPQRDTNAGSFYPLQVITAPNTIFDPSPAAPHGYYFETRIRLFDLLWQCMQKAVPDRLPAGHFASICGTVIAGQHPDTGQRYTLVEPQMGGWGATTARDGMSAMYSTSHGDTYNCPVEICEARYGLDVMYKSLGTAAPASDHQFAGGRGVSLCYRLRTKAVLSAGFTRNRIPVWSSSGAAPGGINTIEIAYQDNETLSLNFASGIALDAGDRVIINTAHGGNNQSNT